VVHNFKPRRHKGPKWHKGYLHMKKYVLICWALLQGITQQLQAQAGDTAICLNQLGFYTKAPKIAVIRTVVAGNIFYVTSAAAGDTVFTGQLSAAQHSANSSLVTRLADFSGLRKKGVYRLLVPGVGYSYPFAIDRMANHAVAVASLKGYYYQRSSTPLEATYAGAWSRPAGHPDTAVLVHPSAATRQRPAGTVIATPGGWYDAGDYNKYIVNCGITMGTLLSAYEDFPGWFDTLRTHIPETGNGVPDILNETVYNLRWMLTMQDPSDGGVYNKCTNAAFDGMVMPGVTKAPRYVVQKGTAAALDFAAVTAQAARVLQRFAQQLPGLRDSCLTAAQKAWSWALQHPDLAYDQERMNKQFAPAPAISTGGYGDRSFSDEWFWAATELYLTTGQPLYQAAVLQHLQEPAVLPSWGNVYLLGYYSLLRYPDRLARDQRELVRKRVLALADSYLQGQQRNAFRTVMGGTVKDFNWGSNANAANQGILLVNAYRRTHRRAYLDGALSNLDYLLGRNATGYCFVTGLGSRSTLHPHHRPSVADGIAAPVPGLLAGGPNPGMQDHSHYPFTEPETAYVDDDGAYASNEIAINWNAPLVYLANAVEALQEAYEGRW
jgi:endoglucanase